MSSETEVADHTRSMNAVRRRFRAGHVVAQTNGRPYAWLLAGFEITAFSLA
jgi:hypothetical protein